MSLLQSSKNYDRNLRHPHQSTAEEWEQYKAMIMNRVRFTENGVETWDPDKEQWEPLTLKAPRRGNTIVTQNDKAMKYKTKVHFEQIPAGVGIEADDSVYGDNLIYKFTEDKWVVNPTFLEQHPDWFEPVDQVQEGQYWVCNGEIKRIESIDDACDLPISYNVITGTDEEGGSCKKSYLLEDCPHRKLSTHEIEQALKNECQNRGLLKGGVTVKPLDNEKREIQWFSDCSRFEYDPVKDILFVHDRVLYQEGEFAEIVDQTPHIEINGVEVKEITREKIKLSCGDNIEGEAYRHFFNLVKRYNLKVKRNDEPINDQLQQIADEMSEPEFAGKRVQISGTIYWDDCIMTSGENNIKL